MITIIVTGIICGTAILCVADICACVEDTVANYVKTKYPTTSSEPVDTPDIKDEDLPPTFDEVMKAINEEWEGVDYEARR